MGTVFVRERAILPPMRARAQKTPAAETVVVVLLALVAALPLIVIDGLFFPFITGKGIAFRLLVAGALLAASVVFLTRKPEAPKVSLIGAALSAFLGVTFFANALGINPERSFFGNFERMEGWLLLAHLGLFYALLSTFFTKARWAGFLTASLCVAALISLIGLLQIGGALPINQGGVRVDANIGNATYLAIYLLFHVFFGLLAAWKTSGVKRITALTAVALFLFILYFTSTRGAFLGLGIGLAVCAVVAMVVAKRGTPLRRSGTAVLAAIVLFSMGAYALRFIPAAVADPLLGRIATISLETGETRLAIWNIAISGTLSRPFLGVGQENFGVLFAEGYTPSLYAQEPWFDRAHNAFIDWLVAGGILGFLAYGALWASAVAVIVRARHALPKEELIVLSGLLAAYATYLLFVFDNLLSYVPFVAVLAYLSSQYGDYAPSWRLKALPRIELFLPALLALIAVLSIVISFSTFTRSVLLIDAAKRGPFNGGLAAFQAALTMPFSGTGIQEVREQLSYAAVGATRTQGISPDVASAYASLAMQEMRKQVASSPGDARVLILAGYLSRSLGDFQGARGYLDAAAALSPQKQQILFEQMLLAFDEKKKDEGLALAERAYALDTRYDDAAVYLAVAHIKRNELPSAHAVLTAHFATTTVLRRELFLVYAEEGKFNELVLLWERKLRNTLGPVGKRAGVRR